MSCAARIQVGDHPPEDAFVAPLHNPQQDARTKAVLDRAGRSGDVKLGAGMKEWDSPLPERMMNTGKPRSISDGAIYSAVSREDERKRRLAMPPQRTGGLKIYIAGPMSGVPYFNFPAFDAAAKMLQSHGHEVFNPAERDRERHGCDISLDNPTGDPAQAMRDHGFSLRDALADDTHYICTTANAIAMLPGWKGSKGAVAEHELAFVLGHTILYLGTFYG